MDVVHFVRRADGGSTEKRLERLRDGEQGEVPRGRGEKAVSCDRERRRPRNIIMYNASSNNS